LFPAEEPDQTCIDHIDGERTNNHCDNLRWASILENNRNATKRANTSSTYKGVYWKKEDKNGGFKLK
jgi:hypothetical protein